MKQGRKSKIGKKDPLSKTIREDLMNEPIDDNCWFLTHSMPIGLSMSVL